MSFVEDIFDAITGQDAQEAAEEQTAFAREALGLQRDIFRQTREDLAPFRETGAQALFSLADLFGVPRPVRQGNLPPQPNTFEAIPPDIVSEARQLTAEFAAGRGDNVAGQAAALPRLQEIRRQFPAIQQINPEFGLPVPSTARQGGGLGGGFQGGFGGPRQAVGGAQQGGQGLPEGTFRSDGTVFTEPGSRRDQALENFFTSPGFEFRFQQGVDAVENANAARGLLQSGQTLQELTRFGQNIASNEFNNFANRLASLAGVGQTGAGQTAQARQQFGQQAGNLLTGIGNARASGLVGQGNAIRNLVGTGIQAAAAFSDRRLKRDITPFGQTEGGFQTYLFRFVDGEDWYHGVMADEIEPHIPEAVSTHDGYLVVDYSKVP